MKDIERDGNSYPVIAMVQPRIGVQKRAAVPALNTQFDLPLNVTQRLSAILSCVPTAQTPSLQLFDGEFVQLLGSQVCRLHRAM
jgi:hypothetical protein